MLLAVPHPTSSVEVRGHRLEHVDIPAQISDRPEILLLHEGLGSVSLWRDFPERVAQRTGARTIAYSRVGFGRSSPRTRPFTRDFMHEEALEIVPALREALGIRHPVLIGHSTGASMALIHASLSPSPSPNGEGSSVAGVLAMAPFAFVERSNVEAIRDNAARDELRDRLRRHHDDVDPIFDGWRDLWTDPGFASWSIEQDLERLRCPVIAILGDRDEYCTPAQLERIARKARHAKVEQMLLADCGHAPHRDQPEAVLRAAERLVTGGP